MRVFNADMGQKGFLRWVSLGGGGIERQRQMKTPLQGSSNEVEPAS